MFAARRAAFPSLRSYSTAAPPKIPVKLIAELRKLTDVSLTKAREALAASNNDVKTALKWLDNDRAATGAARAEKLSGRHAGEGFIGIKVLSSGFKPGSGGVRAAMVELNCETDFVARNERFNKLLGDITHTAAFLAEPSGSDQLLQPVTIDALNEAPLIDHLNPQTSPSTVTVASAIRDLITKVGEKVLLRRAVSVARDPFPAQQATLGLRVFPYLHGSVGDPTSGTMGSLALFALKSSRLPTVIRQEAFQKELATLERALGRTIVGMPLSHNTAAELYSCPSSMFMERLGNDIGEELPLWAQKHGLIGEGSEESGGVEILEFEKWSVGEPLESD